MLSPEEMDGVVKDVMERLSKEDINYLYNIADKCSNPGQFEGIIWRAQQEMVRKDINGKQGFELGE